MPVFIVNKTKAPDKVLHALITAAGQRIGARSNITVVVKQGRGSHVSGHAMECIYINLQCFLPRKKFKKGKKFKSVDGGFFEITLPRPLDTVLKPHDPLERAERFYDVALHEWGHIKDFQHGGLEFSAGARRPAWKRRPEEVRANNYRDEAKERPPSKKAQDAILALGIWLEEEGLKKRGKD